MLLQISTVLHAIATTILVVVAAGLVYLSRKGRLSLGSQGGGPSSEQALIVQFRYGSTDLSQLLALEDKLSTALASANAGEYDGHEIAASGSDGELYLYGPNADFLFHVAEPILKAASFMRGAQVTRRYGPAGSHATEAKSTI